MVFDANKLMVYPTLMTIERIRFLKNDAVPTSKGQALHLAILSCSVSVADGRRKTFRSEFHVTRGLSHSASFRKLWC